jgi:hypothetical protein
MRAEKLTSLSSLDGLLGFIQLDVMRAEKLTVDTSLSLGQNKTVLVLPCTIVADHKSKVGEVVKIAYDSVRSFAGGRLVIR